MRKNMNKSILLLLPLLLFFFISCDLFTNPSGGAENNKTIDVNDLEVILHTLSVFDENYYAVFDFESDDQYIVEQLNMFTATESYKIMKKLPGYTIQYSTIYHRTNQGAKVELKDWDVNDFILSIAFPHPISHLSYFSTKVVGINGDFNRDSGDFGNTVYSASDDELEITVNTSSYDIIFSYYIGPGVSITASLSIDEMDYSTELKEFLESIYEPDDN